jgi:succinate dehydrogenase / fumarate reductase membrane anchor subunit
MLLFTLFMPLYIWQQGVKGYRAWQTFLADPVVALIWATFFLALMVHAWVGVRDILVDYVHSLAWRLSLLTIVAVLLVIMLFWVLGVLLMNSGAGT